MITVLWLARSKGDRAGDIGALAVVTSEVASGALIRRERLHQIIGQATSTPTRIMVRNRVGPVHALLVPGGFHHAYRRAA